MAADPTPTPRGFTVRETARYFRVSPEKIRNWIAKGELLAVNTADPLAAKPRLVVTADAVARFERARQAARPEPPPRRRKRRTPAIDFYPD
jgi:hypothetical protein